MHIPYTNLAHCLYQHTHDGIGIIDARDRAWRWPALQDQARSMAGHLHQQGIRRGDKVLVVMGISPALYTSLAALWHLGAVAVVPEPALGLAGIRHAIDGAKPRAYLSSGWYRLLPWISASIRHIPIHVSPGTSTYIPPVCSIDPHDDALISFTSGTTGTPKGIARSHAFIHEQAKAVGTFMHADTRPHIDLIGFPMFVLANIAHGHTSVLPNWSPKAVPATIAGTVFQRMAKHGIDRALLNPAIMEAIRDYMQAHPSLTLPVHTIYCGGGPIYPDITTWFHTEPTWAEGGRKLVRVYGSTEAEPIAWTDEAPVDTPTMDGAIHAGAPVSGISIRIVDGEIQVAGEHVVQSYMNTERNHGTKILEPDGTVWHRTGDAGRLDDNGDLWLYGRWNAQGIHPFPIEAVARTWPGVCRAAILPDASPILCLEMRPGVAWCLDNDIRDTLTRHGIQDVRCVDIIPMDKRHHSKVDLHALSTMIHDGGYMAIPPTTC